MKQNINEPTDLSFEEMNMTLTTTTSPITARITLTLTAFTMLAACSSETGTGTLVVAASGEAGAEVGYPTSTGPDAIAFADGFTLTFSKVLVSLGHLRLDAADGDSAMVDTDQVIIDLHHGRAVLWELDDVPARRWDRVSYERVPATASARVIGADPADVTAMIAAGASLVLAGTASDGTDNFTFEYAFAQTIHNRACTNGMDETDGIIVAENTTNEAEVTIHLDHMFFDSFAVEEPNLRFEPMAAMADGSGAITLDALAGQELAAPVDREGMPLLDDASAPVVYDPGPLALEHDDLRDYVLAAATTTGHFNGEGHCEYTE